MNQASIWVVITDGASTRICSSGEGVTTLIPALHYAASEPRPEDREFSFRNAYAGWDSGARGKRIETPCRRFAKELAAFLREAGRERAYEGVILIATPKIADELQDVLSPETRALLVGGIVRDRSGQNSGESSYAYN